MPMIISEITAQAVNQLQITMRTPTRSSMSLDSQLRLLLRVPV